MLLGADPEVFIQRRGQVVPVIGLLGGTKKDPLPVRLGAVQEDNVLAEFNILPASTSKDWETNLATTLRDMRSILAQRGYGLTFKASHTFTQKELLEAGPQAMTFGCDPDFNAWERCVNLPPSRATTLRTAGGHIHLGIDGMSMNECAQVSKNCDLFLGVPSVLMDDDTIRRTMYGKAGSFRKKPYGVEYRALSNFWIRNKTLRRWAYSQSHKAAQFTERVPDEVATCINTGNRQLALQLVKEFDLEVAV